MFYIIELWLRSVVAVGNCAEFWLWFWSVMTVALKKLCSCLTKSKAKTVYCSSNICNRMTQYNPASRQLRLECCLSSLAPLKQLQLCMQTTLHLWQCVKAEMVRCVNFQQKTSKRRQNTCLPPFAGCWEKIHTYHLSFDTVDLHPVLTLRVILSLCTVQDEVVSSWNGVMQVLFTQHLPMNERLLGRWAVTWSPTILLHLMCPLLKVLQWQ